VKLGIWCDFEFTLRPNEGIGVFVAHLLSGLGRQPNPPEVALLVNAADPRVHSELLAYCDGLKAELLVPRGGLLRQLKTLVTRRLSPHIKGWWSWMAGRGERWASLLPRKAVAAMLHRARQRSPSRVLRGLVLVAALPLILIDAALTVAFFGLKYALLVVPNLLHPTWRSLKAALWADQYAGVFEMARRAQCDVWLLPYPGLPAAPDLRAPLVMVVHDLVYRHFPEGFDSRANTDLFDLTHLLAQQVAVCACVSETVRQNELIDTLNVSEERARVVLHAVPDDLLRLAPVAEAELRGRHRLPRRFFFYPGAFRPYKNHVLAVRALALLQRQLGSDIGMVFTGISRPPAGLRRVIVAEGVTDSVLCLGSVSRPEMAALYEAAAGLVFPSFHEGFGLPVIEALALGCPVLCSDIAVLREVTAAYGRAVSLFNPYSADDLAKQMARLLAQRSDLREPLEQARAKVRARGWDVAASEWLAICEQAGAQRQAEAEADAA
jgi:glycosyltransferase involved in cell wall biosynthesis